MGALGGAPEHATEARYRLGCRCARCRKASSDARARRKAAREARDGAPAPAATRQAPVASFGGAVERSVREAVGSIELDVWGQAMAELAINAAKRVDSGDASPAHFQQVRELLDAVKSKGDPTNATRLGGLAGIIGSRGRVDSRAVSGA